MSQQVQPESDVLKGARVALTGRFALMTQREFSGLVAQLGGEFVSVPGRNTDWLVVGVAAPPVGPDGQPTQALRRAEELRSAGANIQIAQEDAFLERLGLFDAQSDVHQRYTVAQLSRILDVSRDRIRLWVRWGLIEPIETVHRLDFFDFQQVNSAKLLCDLLDDGISFGKLREGLGQIQQWMPDLSSPLSQLSVIEETGRLLVRLEDGRLAEPTGQLQLDFEAATEQRSLSIGDGAKTSEQWFQEALEWENQGDYQAAVQAYHRAVEQEPSDPILHFNLGNVLYASQQYHEAEQEFRRAVELDDDYVEGWNNLGTVLADMERYDDSIQAFDKAISVFPLYADAHFNMGDVLAAIGKESLAREHWRRYLQLDPKSPWAADVRVRLAELGN